MCSHTANYYKTDVAVETAAAVVVAGVAVDQTGNSETSGMPVHQDTYAESLNDRGGCL